MNILAINGSPKGENSITYKLMLEPFIKGIEEADVKVKLLHVNKLNINPCQGCFYCQQIEPGICSEDDDMTYILGLVKQSDIIIFSTPLFSDGFSGQVKILIDRLIPLIKMDIEKINGSYLHPLREGVLQKGRIILISSCFHWHLENFNPILEHVKAISKNMHRIFSGAMLRPHSFVFKKNICNSSNIIQCAEKLGKYFINKNQELPKELLLEISKPAISLEQYIKIVNGGD